MGIGMKMYSLYGAYSFNLCLSTGQFSWSLLILTLMYYSLLLFPFLCLAILTTTLFPFSFLFFFFHVFMISTLYLTFLE
ncbi:hypothetical protein HOY80DRAFT_977612 [Tuber brumale]|nr:hypothetical protein HOY80DRAFT_977612 [Tuber brumale]